MKIYILLSAILASAFALPPLVYGKVIYGHSGAPIGLDGRVIDTPEVALAKAEHEAAHINEKINLAQEAVKSADQHVLAYIAPASVAVIGNSHLVQPVATKLIPGAPLGPDGRVVDTPDVALAKAEHAAAHINEKHNHYIAKSISQPIVVLDQGASYSVPSVYPLNLYVH